MQKSITLRAGGSAFIDQLGASDLPEVLALQDAAYASLSLTLKSATRFQSTAYFQNLLTRQTGVMVGVRTEGKLIAQLCLLGPMDVSEAIALHVVTDNDVPFSHAALTDSVIVFKDMSVHPHWRDTNLEASLVAYALELPMCRIANHIFTQVFAEDKKSHDTYALQGFGLVAAAEDLKSRQPTFIFQKPIFGFDFSPTIIVDDVDPILDFSAIVNLTQRDALVGLYEKGSNDRLEFFRNRDVLNIMPTLAKMQGQK
jgi:hypothetical protein